MPIFSVLRCDLFSSHLRNWYRRERRKTANQKIAKLWEKASKKNKNFDLCDSIRKKLQQKKKEGGVQKRKKKKKGGSRKTTMDIKRRPFGHQKRSVIPQLNVVFNSLPFWVSAIYFPVKQREKKKKVLARRRGKGKAKRGKKGTK